MTRRDSPISPPGSSDALVVRWSRRTDRRGRWRASVALLGVLAACAAGSASASASTIARGAGGPRPAAYVFPAGDPNTLEGRIANRMEGAQLDVLRGGAPTPGATTEIVFHHGNWAAEVYWKTDGWCLARVYTWRVLDAVSETQFRLDYRVTQEYTDCIMHWGDHQRLDVTGVRTVNGLTTLDARYGPPSDEPTTRTVCSMQWDDGSPCGFGAAAAVRPSPDV